MDNLRCSVDHPMLFGLESYQADNTAAVKNCLVDPAANSYTSEHCHAPVKVSADQRSANILDRPSIAIHLSKRY